MDLNNHDDLIEKTSKITEEVRTNIFYIIICVLSFVILLVFPFLGTKLNVQIDLPNTTGGWIFYIVSKALVSVLNLFIFISFTNQAKINVKNNQKYIEATNILGRYNSKEYKPRSPHKFKFQAYFKKGTSIVFGTCISLIGISQAIISYDWISLIGYFIVVVMSITFGAMNMIKAEEYWTTEYYDYAVKQQKEKQINDNDKR